MLDRGGLHNLKICNKCGAEQTDKRYFCDSCGEKLGGSLSEREAESFKQQEENNLSEMHKKTDPLYVSDKDKIIGCSAIIGNIGTIIYIIINIIFNNSNTKHIPAAIYSATFFFLSALSALLPKLLWELEKFRLSFIIKATYE
ncbi:MAG: hypothetical protein K0S55_1979, partial [Clostridia bacterium]|nr:hypothetical protein [Clostridia bacterium]